MSNRKPKPNSSARFSKGQVLDINCGSCGNVNRRIAGEVMSPCDKCEALVFMCEYKIVEGTSRDVSDRESS